MFEFIKWSIFILFSIALIVFSWESLQKVRSYGFFRFFVFEALLSLLLVNVEYWFIDPFSPLQIVSWIFLGSSLIVALIGTYILVTKSKLKNKIENSLPMVKTGIYRYIRHPLYGSLILFGIGAFLKQISIVSIIDLIAVVALVIITSRIEEDENLEKFGSEYSYYLKTTKMFVPHLF